MFCISSKMYIEEGNKKLPIEDIAAIIITSFSAKLHSNLLVESARHGVALVICDRFSPVSLLLPANRSSDTLLTKAELELDKKKKASIVFINGLECILGYYSY